MTRSVTPPRLVNGKVRLLTSPGRGPSPGSELCSAAWQVNLIRRRNRPRSQLWSLSPAFSTIRSHSPRNVLSRNRRGDGPRKRASDDLLAGADEGRTWRHTRSQFWSQLPPFTLRAGALLSRACQVSSFCADTDGHTLADLESGGVWEPFWEPDGPTSQHGNGLTRARAANSELTVGPGGPLRTPDQTYGQVVYTAHAR